MHVQEIMDLPVSGIASDNAALFLWATFPRLREALAVMDAWGFRYRTVGFTWVKLNGRQKTPFFGTGYYTKSNAEICLLGVRGQLKPVCNGMSSIVLAPRRRHSEKPSEVRDRIVSLFGDRSRIELFAREHTPGWEVWGAEVPDISRTCRD